MKISASKNQEILAGGRQFLHSGVQAENVAGQMLAVRICCDDTAAFPRFLLQNIGKGVFQRPPFAKIDRVSENCAGRKGGKPVKNNCFIRGTAVIDNENWSCARVFKLLHVRKQDVRRIQGRNYNNAFHL